MNNTARSCARWLLLSLPITLALVFSGAFFAPFSAPKNAILVLTTFALAAVALASSSRWKPERDQRLFWIAAATYLAVTSVSAVMSQNRSMCLQSVELAACGVLLLAASLGSQSGEDGAFNTRNLQIAISVAAVVVSLLTVAQFFSIDLHGTLGQYANNTGRMRMYATLGNPDFVAALLAVAAPAAIALSITAQRLRALWVSAPVLIGVAILLTGSRGGLIAFAVGVIVIAFTAMHRRVLIRVAVVVAVAVACALAAGTQLNARTPWESLRGRIFIWQVSLGDGAAPSAFGSGPGTFAYNYPLRLGQFFAKPGHEPLLRFAGHERHAQNDFVEALHDTGWLGLGSQLALLAAWFAVAIRKLLKADRQARPAIAAAIASVSALCVASLFDFPMHRAETWALLWLSMAVPLVSPTLPPAPKRRLAWLRFTAAALLLVAGSYLAFAPLAASYKLAKGATGESQGNLEASLTACRIALRLDPSSPDANFDMVRALAKTGDYAGALAQSNATTRYVNEPELYILRSRILQIEGRSSEARQEVEAATHLFPYSLELRDEVVSLSESKTELESR